MIEPDSASKQVEVHFGGAEYHTTSPLASSDIQLPSVKQQAQLLQKGEVFVLDDERSMLFLGARLIQATFSVPPEIVHAINPKEIESQIPEVPAKLERTLKGTIEPIVKAAQDPDRGVALVLSDFEMGAITGDMVIQALKETLGTKLPFKVIINSGNSERVLSGARQYDGFIPKPVSTDALKKTVHSLFEEKKY